MGGKDQFLWSGVDLMDIKEYKEKRRYKIATMAVVSVVATYNIFAKGTPWHGEWFIENISSIAMGMMAGWVAGSFLYWVEKRPGRSK